MSAVAPSSPPPPSAAAAQRRYGDIMAECQQLMTKVAELEVDMNEHALVEATLKPMGGDRRAYRLVGDVLVERTVAEVLPSVTKNRENVSAARAGIVGCCCGLLACCPLSIPVAVALSSEQPNWCA
jgi:prefoldin subunit 2